jgi:hypothetical protein
VKARGTLIPGAILVLLGLYFLGAQFHLPLPGFDQFWPGLIVLGGLLILADAATGGGRSRVFPGVLLILLGLTFFLFTLRLRLPALPLPDGVGWPHMALLWPVFVLDVGLAFLAQWLVQPAKHGARNMSLLTLLVGLIALAINFSANDLFRQIARLWPLLLVAAGVQMLLGYFRRGRGSSQ